MQDRSCIFMYVLTGYNSYLFTMHRFAMTGHTIPQILLLALTLLTISPPSMQQDSIYNNLSPSEVVNSSDGRITGAQKRSLMDFVLGGIFPIHHSSDGGAACGEVRLEKGLERLEAFFFSIDLINADNTLLQGLTLGYDVRDTCSSQNIGLDETVDLVITRSNLDIESCPVNMVTTDDFLDSPTSAVIGAAASFISVPVASLLRLFNIPQISYASSSPLLSNRDRYGYFYRTIHPDDLQAQAMIDILLYYNWTFVSTIFSRNQYGEPGINRFKFLAEKYGICIDVDQAIESDFSDEEFKTLAKRLIDSNANVIVMFTSSEDPDGLFKHLVNTSDPGRFTWIASDAWARSFSLARNYSTIINGLIGFVPFTEQKEKFHDYFSQLTVDNNKRNPWFGEYFAAKANCSLSENSTDGKAPCSGNSSVPDAVDSYEQGNFIPLVVNAVYAFAVALDNFLKDNCRQPVQWFSNNRTCLDQTRDLNGSALLEYIGEVNFTSPTGTRVVFDSQGNVMGQYEIVNLQAMNANGEMSNDDFVFKTVGLWDSSKVNESLQLFLNENIQFGIDYAKEEVLTIPPDSYCGRCTYGEVRLQVKSFCCTICMSCRGQSYSYDPQAYNCSMCDEYSWGNDPTSGSNSCVPLKKTYLSYDHPFSIIIMIIALAGLFQVSLTVVVFAKFWTTPIVKSSGREQMSLLLVGISLSFISAFFYASPPTPAICGIQRWIVMTSFATMFGALLVKTVRVARIFLNKGKNLQIRFTDPKYQVLFTFIIVVIQWVIVFGSFGRVPPELSKEIRLVSDMPDQTPTLVVTCVAESLEFLILSIGYESFLIVLCTIFGTITFNLPDNFNEAKYISFCSMSILVIWIAYIITFFATQMLREYQSIATSLAVVMSGYAVFFTIFGPKLFRILFKPDTNSLKYSMPTRENTVDSTETTVQSRDIAPLISAATSRIPVGLGERMHV